MLTLVPCTLKDAEAFVEQHHRHHRPPRGGLFAVAVAAGAEVVGVAIIGRPVARGLQDGWTAEVTRVSVETGTSLRGVGWRCIGQAGGGSWSCPSRPRVDHHPTQVKLRWERTTEESSTP